jgi:hypothetical protein
VYHVQRRAFGQVCVDGLAQRTANDLAAQRTLLRTRNIQHAVVLETVDGDVLAVQEHLKETKSVDDTYMHMKYRRLNKLYLHGGVAAGHIVDALRHESHHVIRQARHLRETMEVRLKRVDEELCRGTSETRRTLKVIFVQSRLNFAEDTCCADQKAYRWREIRIQQIGDYRFSYLAHVVGEDLLVLLAALRVAGFDDKFGREDVAELRAITVTPTDHLQSK